MLKGIVTRAELIGARTAMLEHIGSGYQDLLEDITIGNVSSWQQFTLCGLGSETDNGGAYFLADTLSGPFATMRYARKTRYLQPFFHYIRPGYIRTGVEYQSTDLQSIAFRSTEGRPVIIIIGGNDAKFVTLEELPPGTYEQSVTNSEVMDEITQIGTLYEGMDVGMTVEADDIIVVYATSLLPTTAVDAIPVADGLEVTAYPNPFGATLTLQLSLRTGNDYSIALYDALGREVYSAFGSAPSGSFQHTIPAQTLPAGAYRYRITSGGAARTGTLVKR